MTAPPRSKPSLPSEGTLMKHVTFASSGMPNLSAGWRASCGAVKRSPRHALKFFLACGAALVAALAAAGCAAPVYEGKYDWHEGWREARVVKVGKSAELGGRHSFDCRYRKEVAQLPTAQFIVLSYENMSRTRRSVVPLHQGENFRPGDLVYLKLRSCDVPLAMSSSSPG